LYREIKGYSGTTVYEYTSSMSHDSEIIREAVGVVAAHTLHLYEKGVIGREAYCKVAISLLELLRDPSKIYGDGGEYEDIWEALEAWLTKQAGSVAGEIWIGRSRNDHVSAALRLRAIRGALKLMSELTRVRRSLIGKAEASWDKWLLLHTHSQPAQLAPASCLLLSWEESMASIFAQMKSVLEALNRSPLGSSAGAGSLAPLDPSRLASLLGFREPIGNPLYATGSRLDLTAYSSTLSMLMVELSRIAEDLMLLSSPYVGAVVLPDSHVATSSVMPHKRNPVTLEVVRARAKIAVSILAGLMNVQTGLPSGYSLDLQEINPLMYTLESEALSALGVINSVVEGFKWSDEGLNRMQKEFIGYGAELAEYIALHKHVPFREAYKLVAENLKKGHGLGKLLEETGAESPVDLVSRRQTGCTVDSGFEGALERLGSHESLLAELKARLERALSGVEDALYSSTRECREEN
jgi:argininosuccinate lyase